MKKVLMHGYVANNLGDDLFFEYVAKKYPDIQFDICATKKKIPTFSNVSNINILYPSNFRLFIYKIINKLLKKQIKLYKINRDYELSLTVGGSLFIQNKNWEKKAKIFKKKITNKNLILGTNFGPFKDERYLEYYKKSFEQFEDICFRDKDSFKLFCGNSNIRYAPDILFGFKPIKLESEKKIFVSVIKPSIRESLVNLDENYYNGIYKLCKDFIKNDFKVILTSFCQDEGDEEAIQYIYGMFNENEKKYVEKLYYDGTNRNLIINEIASSEIIIATRFHAMILGWVHEKKVLPILYSDKMLNVIKDVNFDGVYIDLRNKKQDYNIANEDIRKLKGVHNLSEESLKHFKVLNLLIK